MREDVQAEARWRHATLGAHALDEFFDFGDVEFDDLVGVYADKDVAWALLAVDELVVGLFAVDEDALDDAGLGQELERAIDGGLADAEAVGLEAGDDLIGLEQAVEAEDDVEDVGAFGGVLEALAAERSAEDGAHGLDDGEAGYGVCGSVGWLRRRWALGRIAGLGACRAGTGRAGAS